ncbi:hypothetical protein PN499_22215 [Kamptonema animale CS-326]|jgi:hypothetical protein|uniref:hypothetical protein n=1 Tax=Kamptonema animale TaxID=92934 RepID=UPI00232DCB01|nr:hypothetical protein [Kamptonema animale]MDB9513919.1 hypothetical protein [Kamptonema animale CS-326]
MAILIPSKSEKNASQLRDALRILAWQQYKSDNPEIKGLEGYEVFEAEWKIHDIQAMNEQELLKLIKDLGYSLADILKVRTDYYIARNNNYPKNEKSNVIPGDFGNHQVTDFATQVGNDAIPY